jgi:hypothetical protein
LACGEVDIGTTAGELIGTACAGAVRFSADTDETDKQQKNNIETLLLNFVILISC